jgi:hypothetical protein
MNEPIKRGDLVLVAKACPFCGDTADLGQVFVVNDLFQSGEPMNCCGDRTPAVCASSADKDWCGTPLALLKRIPPLSELDDVRQDEEIEA